MRLFFCCAPQSKTQIVNSSQNTTRYRQKHALITTAVAAILCIGAACFLILREKSSSPDITTTPTSSALTVMFTAVTEQQSVSKLPGEIQTTTDSIEALAQQDPDHALALSLAEADTDRRELLLQAFIRGWAQTAPDAAANWALIQGHLDQGRAMAALFNGANKNPDAAIQLATRLSNQHPEEANSYGSYLIFGLSQVGQFELAANYAATSPDEIRTNLLAGAYTYWARQQPEKALRSAMEINDPAKQDTAFHATVSGSAHANPQSLTNAAYQFPEGQDRVVALTGGLRAWLENDPAAAGEWMAQHKLTAKETERALEE